MEERPVVCDDSTAARKQEGSGLRRRHLLRGRKLCSDCLLCLGRAQRRCRTEDGRIGLLLHVPESPHPERDLYLSSRDCLWRRAAGRVGSHATREQEEGKDPLIREGLRGVKTKGVGKPTPFCFARSRVNTSLISDVTGVLLAGGKSRRMGQDKRLLSVGEETLY